VLTAWPSKRVLLRDGALLVNNKARKLMTSVFGQH
jgi:hypothetical protein